MKKLKRLTVLILKHLQRCVQEKKLGICHFSVLPDALDVFESTAESILQRHWIVPTGKNGDTTNRNGAAGSTEKGSTEARERLRVNNQKEMMDTGTQQLRVSIVEEQTLENEIIESFLRREQRKASGVASEVVQTALRVIRLHAAGHRWYTSLVARHCSIGAGGGIALLDQCHYLFEIDLAGNKLGDRSGVGAGLVGRLQWSSGFKDGAATGTRSTLGAAYTIGPSLKVLLNSETLSRLDLSNNCLTDEDGQFICEGLKGINCSVKHINLRHNNFGPIFGRRLANALDNNTSIKEVLIGSNRLLNRGVIPLINELLRNNTLELLDLSWTGLTDDCGKLIAELITSNQVLCGLCLAHNNVGSKGMHAIAKALLQNKSLLQLDLSFNPIGDAAVADFLMDLVENKTLEFLDLRCTVGSNLGKLSKMAIRESVGKRECVVSRQCVLFATSPDSISMHPGMLSFKNFAV